MMIPEVEQFAQDRIAAAELVRHPFPHIYVEGLFPEPFYRELLQNLPADDCYTARPMMRGWRSIPTPAERPSWERFGWGLRNG
jgi:hypothetical protein